MVAFILQLNRVLQPPTAFSCASDMNSIITSVSYLEATDLYSMFQTSAVESLLVDQLGAQCGDFAWIQVSGCMSDAVFM
jgi:hypothetical protein